MILYLSCNKIFLDLYSIRRFFETQNINIYSKDGVPCREVARLIFADFPTSLLVDGLAYSPFGMYIVFFIALENKLLLCLLYVNVSCRGHECSQMEHIFQGASYGMHGSCP